MIKYVIAAVVGWLLGGLASCSKSAPSAPASSPPDHIYWAEVGAMCAAHDGIDRVSVYVVGFSRSVLITAYCNDHSQVQKLWDEP